MLPLVLSFLLRSSLTADPTCSPQAVRPPCAFGPGFSGFDVLWVEHSFTALLGIPSWLRDISEQLYANLLQLEEDLDEDVPASSEVLYSLHACASEIYLNGTITLALENSAALQYIST